MPLTLRSLLLPLSLSGALALVGLWWYVTRKKAGLADHDSQEGKTSADLSPAPDDGMGQKVEKGSGEEQGVEGGANGPDADTADATRTSEAASGGGSEAAAPQPGAADRGEPGPAEASPRKDLPPSGKGDRASTPARSPDVAEEKRPDPEGEVGGGDAEECKAAVRLAELQLRSNQSDDRAPSGEIVRPALPEAAEPVRPPPAGAKEMQQLAEGMISHMVSAAVAEVLQATAAGKTLPEQAGGPSRARELCAAVPDGGPADDGETQGRKPEDGGPTTDGEGGASPAAGEGCGGGLAEEEEDSTSSSQAGDSSSDEDYRVPSRSGAEAPEEPEDPDKSVTTTRGRPEVLRNGHGKEEEPLTQDHGVTGMTRYCEQTAADGQVSSLQSSLSSLPPPETTEPHTIWEFEVPKHLVGRMIGKQGRYVSYLEATSGATVFISAVPYTQEIQLCHIEGTEGQVEAALDLIRMKFKDLELTNCYAQPPVLSLPSLPITSWLLLPHRVTVEVQVVQVASGNYLFVQQHTHPTFHALRVLDQQMSLCYSHPGCPSLPAPVEVGVICAAQVPEGAWWRAQVMRFNEESREVEIRYVDYGGYHTVNIDSLRQIRSDFVSLPFQGSEVILENLAPLSGEDHFSDAAKLALEDLTQGVSLLAQVTEFHTSGIPLVQIWKKEENQLVSVNQALVERGVCSWINRP